MTAYDGGLLRLPNAPLPMVVDLAGMQHVDQVKALLHHDPALPVGHMDQVTIGNTIETSGVLSVPENASRIEAAQKNGFSWEASIGATNEPGTIEMVPRGHSVQVNGRTFHGPLMVARRATLREVSFVGVGAGENTSSRIVAMATPISLNPASDPMALDPNKNDNTNDNSDSGAGGQGPGAGNAPRSADTELAEIRASWQAEIDATRKAREDFEAETKLLRQERLVESVDRIAAQYSCSDDTILASLRDKARAGDVSESDIELHILRAAGNHKLRGFQPIGAAKDGPTAPHVIEAAFCLTTGWDENELAGHFDEKTINAAIGNKWIGFGLHAMGVEYLRAHGHHVLGGKLTDEDIKAAMQFAESETIQASGGFSSFSLPGILSNVARKEVIRGYDAFPKVILKIASTETATDYKPFYRYRLNTDGLLQQVGADGELKSMELTEDSYQSRVYPFGRKLAITNVMWKNDDAGAFRRLSQSFGLTASRTIEREGFKTLLSEVSTFWTTGKGNRLASGAGSALSLDSLNSAYTLFLKFQDSTNQPIGIRPRYLVTASQDHTLGIDLNKGDRINMAVRDTAAANEIIERTSRNTFQGMFEPESSPYLDNGVVTNANGTQWLLCADPAICAAIVAAFLDGRRVPMVKHWESLPGRMGMQWDMTMNFGFNLEDDKSSVYSPGQ